MAKARTRTVRKLERAASAVLERRSELESLTDADLAGTASRLRGRLESGETIDDVQVDAYAAVCEVARRSLGFVPHHVQVYGACVLHTGAVAEMRTGEGKTVTAVMCAFLNALQAPVDVVTANPYLARRDAQWMGQLYRALGLTCAPALAGMSRATKQRVYRHDVVYSTTNELGFDWMRDRLAMRPRDQVRRGRGHAFVLIDEADQVLLDEARTPLIMSGPSASPADLCARADHIVSNLDAGRRDPDTGEETGHFVADRADVTVHLTDAGADEVERIAGVDDLFADAALAYRVHAALEAHALMESDREYLLRDGEVLIVDEATGRVMEGRRFGKGLHEALEAKHGLEVRDQVRTRATITVQNYFRLYDRLSGMTGTAATSADEFAGVYDLRVHAVPTNVPVARIDQDDVMFLTVDAKHRAAVAEIRDRQRAGQPVLVGAATVASAHQISGLLAAEGVEHNLLSARDHSEEALTVAQAGRPGVVTVATNMAGRGTDIRLGGDAAAAARQRLDAMGDVDEATRAQVEAEEEQRAADDRQQVLDAGGLLVLGTERHASRRIDDQLRGRSGRQGGPGESVFYVSLEDDLLSLFSSTPLDWAVEKLADRDAGRLDELDQDDPVASTRTLPGAERPIHHPMMGKAVEKAQQRVEEMHATARRSVLEFDEVVTDQREAVYARREQMLCATATEVVELVELRLGDALDELLSSYEAVPAASWDRDALVADCRRFGLDAAGIVERAVAGDVTGDDALRVVRDAAWGRLLAREQEYGDAWPAVCRSVLLTVLDTHWVELLGDLEEVRSAIGWRSVAQLDPVTEFRVEAHRRFEQFARVVRLEQGERILTAAVQVGPAA